MTLTHLEMSLIGAVIALSTGGIVKYLGNKDKMTKTDHKQICGLTTNPIRKDIGEIKKDVKAILKYYQQDGGI